jgi:hypothetical protein
LPSWNKKEKKREMVSPGTAESEARRRAADKGAGRLEKAQVGF